jgi:outer membrane protein assembly factor BamB
VRKWLKWTLGTLGAVVLLALAALAFFWPSLRIMMGSGGIRGKEAPIPRPASSPPPLEKGPADWPCWRGPRGDGQSAVSGIWIDGSGGLPKLWEVNYLCRGEDAASWSAPVVAGNRLVVPGRDGTRDAVFCLHAATGELLWLAAYDAPVPSSHGSGARATPCIDGDRVYTFGRGGNLACWGLLDGAPVWRRNVKDEGGAAPQWGHSSSPLVVGDLVVVQGGGSCRAIAFDKRTGRTAWKSGQGPAGYAAPALAEIAGTPQILLFHGKGIAGIEPAGGRELWNHPWETDFDVNATTPVAAGNLVFVTSNYGKGGGLLRVGPSGAEPVWTTKEFASHHSDPILLGGHLYGYEGPSFQNRGKFKCLEVATGTVKWSTSDIGWGTTTGVDGLLLCLDIRGNLFLVKPDPSAFVKVAEWRGALGNIEGPAWTVPVAANGRLYLRHKQTLACHDLTSR